MPNDRIEVELSKSDPNHAKRWNRGLFRQSMLLFGYELPSAFVVCLHRGIETRRLQIRARVLRPWNGCADR